MTKFIDVSDDTKEEKKTVLTHCFEHDGLTKIIEPIENFDKIIYLGKCRLDGDMFACYDDEGNIIIYKGKKGSEFD